MLLIWAFMVAFVNADYELKLTNFINDLHKSIHTVSEPTSPAVNSEETTSGYWNTQAQKRLLQQLERKINTGVAKNVIYFVGDGMSIPTLAAARIYLGQKYGKTGEETQLSFETFPYVGLSKTYCVDKQVADSACSATAYLCGVKGNLGTIGVTANVSRNDCEGMNFSGNHVFSLARHAQIKRKRTGLVTTTRVTHASPAGVYAHIANRDWESDTSIMLSARNPKNCNDIAKQLVYGETGRNLNVVLGGGRTKFLPLLKFDEDGNIGTRLDKRDLIQEWGTSKNGTKHKYVGNKKDLLNVPLDTDYVFGLFDGSHLSYNLERDQNKQPSLAEMTKKAIELLSNSSTGFFLFVEGGLIDKAHHDDQPKKALDETVEFHKAIETAMKMTNEEDTLIVITSDHAHTMSMSGYPKRGNDILGIAGKGIDLLPYPTISYANGLGYQASKNGKRYDISKDNLTDVDYRFPAYAPLMKETHGGDDVAIFARGPWAHLFSGVLEQNYIAHAINFASCTGEGVTACKKFNKEN